MITLDSVSVTYSHSTPLDSLSVTFGPGTTAVMGPSGSGKSTLLRLIAGLQAPTGGTLNIDGLPVQGSTWNKAGEPRVSLVHQDYRLVAFLTVQQNLVLAAELRGRRPQSSEVNEAVSTVGLPTSMLDRFPPTMSGGEQQRVAIARALLTGAKVILADEPTGALDQENTERVSAILTRVGQLPGLVVLIATHDIGVAQQMDRCLRLSAGKTAPVTTA